MFEAVVGQHRAKGLLTASIQRDEISHAYLFKGEKGVGKGSLALAFAKALLCGGGDPEQARRCGERIDHGNHPDVVVIEAAEGTIKIAQVREIINLLPIRPYEGGLRVIVIRGADKMTIDAQNALLKSLEEPEACNVFILTAESVERVVSTIRSRCQVVSFEPLGEAEIRRVLLKKGYTDADAVSGAVYTCGGSPGKALSLLENSELENLKMEALDLFYAILRGDIYKVFPFGEKVSKNKDTSVEVARFLITWLHGMVRLFEGIEEPGNPYGEKQERFKKQLTPERCQEVAAILFELLDTLQYNVNLRLQWEGALLKI